MRDLTEGIDLAKMSGPFLKRNMPPVLDIEEEYNRVYTPYWSVDNLVIRISPKNYHMQYEPPHIGLVGPRQGRPPKRDARHKRSEIRPEYQIQTEIRG